MNARQELIEGVIIDRATIFFDALDHQRKVVFTNDLAELSTAVQSSAIALKRLNKIVELKQRDNQKGCLEWLVTNLIVRWM